MPDEEIPVLGNGKGDGSGDRQGDRPAEIVITLRLTPTPNGPGLHVDVQPAGVFPDTVIDACARAARFLERMEAARAIVGAQQQAVAQAANLQRQIGIIRGKG